MLLARYYRVATYVPFVVATSSVYQVHQHPWVTLPDHLATLKRAYPTIRSIATLADATPHDVVILPWHARPVGFRHLLIQDTPFYHHPRGSIPVRQWSWHDDGYADFLANRVVMTVGGTVVLARGVYRAIQRQGGDVHMPWRGTRALFQSADLAMVNFKSPLVADYQPPPSSWILYGPDRLIDGMVSANINVVSISGNHMGDAGHDGLMHTIQQLQQHGISPVGAGAHHSDAYGCYRVQKKGQWFGVLAFNNVGGSIGKATKHSPGIAWLDQDALSAVQACDPMVDQLVVMVNWGIEYVHQPRWNEVAWAYQLVKHGADIVIGDQAHWVQSHQRIGTAHVSYGLGNYIFDQHWSVNTTEGVIVTYVFYQGMRHYVDVVPVALSRHGAVSVIPMSSDRYLAVLHAYHALPPQM